MNGGRLGVAGAWAVHAYTASGAVLAFLSARAAIGGDVRAAFLWLFAAVAIDATDGWLARVARVGERLPSFSGARLDNLVDYLTFVFVPALIVWQAGLVPSSWGMAAVVAMLLSSAYGFASEDAKTSDHFFTGFPSYWNVAALYLVAANLAPAANAAILLALAALVFVPIGYVYPTRTPVLRGLTLTLAVVWGALVLAMIDRLPHPPRALVWLSLVFPIYYVALSVVLNRRRAVGGQGSAGRKSVASR
jgi:phosphatidylcholine synthase